MAVKDKEPVVEQDPIQKEAPVDTINTIKIISRLKHDEFITYNGEQLMIPAQGSVLLSVEGSVGILPSGLTRINL